MVSLGFSKVLYVFQFRLELFDIFIGGIQVSSVNLRQASMAFIGFGECNELGVTLCFLNFFLVTVLFRYNVSETWLVRTEQFAGLEVFRPESGYGPWTGLL